MERSEALRRLTDARLGHLATMDATRRPHIVPVTYAVIGNAIVHMVDQKPKTTHRLKRIANLNQNPRASILVDHYEEDWRALWWVRVDGPTTIFTHGVEWESARGALTLKYPQYRQQEPAGPAIYLRAETITSWAYTD